MITITLTNEEAVAVRWACDNEARRKARQAYEMRNNYEYTTKQIEEENRVLVETIHRLSDTRDSLTRSAFVDGFLVWIDGGYNGLYEGYPVAWFSNDGDAEYFAETMENWPDPANDPIGGENIRIEDVKATMNREEPCNDRNATG